MGKRLLYGIIPAGMLLAIAVSFSFAVKEKPVVRPAYAEEKFWIALPWRTDAGDVVPPGCPTPENQANAVADVFYVHPTMFVSGPGWNGDLEDVKLNGLGDTCVKLQATPFNSCARVFAPRYRQGHLKCFTREGQKGEDALDTAYADVKKAFEHYLANWNNGRPIILAGHSQGAYHVSRLLEDFFDGKPLLHQLVAAYPIGFETAVHRFKQIPVGTKPDQTGCFMTWNTVAWGQDTGGLYKRYRGSACVNPLTWTTTSTIADFSDHSGAVPFDFKAISKNALRAKIHGTLLWIEFASNSMKRAFRHLGDNYHVSDVNLFYLDIRENAELRVKAFTNATSQRK
jgi:hypothetical protein